MTVGPLNEPESITESKAVLVSYDPHEAESLTGTITSLQRRTPLALAVTTEDLPPSGKERRKREGIFLIDPGKRKRGEPRVKKRNCTCISSCSHKRRAGKCERPKSSSSLLFPFTVTFMFSRFSGSLHPKSRLLKTVRATIVNINLHEFPGILQSLFCKG